MSSESPSQPGVSWATFTSTGSKKGDPKSGGVPTNIKEIEQIVGFVNDEYECLHNNFSGTLYAGPIAVVWLGRVFFFEWTVIIKWDDVAQVHKQPNGVRFTVNTPKPATYDFDQMFNPDKAWSSLVSLHNDTILDMPRRAPTPRQVTRTLRRMNSDPLRMSMVFNFDGPPDAIGGDEDHPLVQQDIERRRNVKRLSHAASVPLGEHITTVQESLSQESTEEPASAPPDAPPAPTKATIEKLWSKFLEESTAYSETAVDQLELPCTLEAFYNHFVDDDAKHSMPMYMRSNGDEDIQCSPWKDSDDGLSQTRTIEYNHPINAPMAPPMAGARKEQTCRSFGENALILETKTYVRDVPMTDCFYVADQIRVEPRGEKVTITMSFDITFVKSTMFKSIISRTTKTEFEAFVKSLANYMAKSLGEEAVIPTPPPTPVQEVAAPSVAIPFMPEITLGLLVFVMLLQLWIMSDIRATKFEVRQLLQNLPKECSAPYQD